MSKETKIEWADSTVNFWSGCTKVSAGCTHCYAESLSNRKLGNIGEWGVGAPRKRHQSAFNLALQLNKKPWVCDGCGNAVNNGEPFLCKCSPTKTKFHRRRVFSLSLGDWLDPEVPIEWLAEMLDTIRRCDQLQWLLVTKRPELFQIRLLTAVNFLTDGTGRNGDWWQFMLDWICGKAPAHVMVLTSVEDQKAADERIPALLKIPAAQRGLSCEPLLGPVNLVSQSTQRGAHYKTIVGTDWLEEIDWVIVGGESGPGARACNVEWIRSIGNQCDAAGVPVFVKQLGANPTQPMLRIGAPSNEDVPLGATRLITSKKGGDITEWPLDLRVREFPKVL